MVRRSRAIPSLRAGVQQPNYQLGRWFDSLIQHRIADHREFLARRDAAHTHGVCAVLGGLGGRQLRDESFDAGEEE